MGTETERLQLLYRILSGKENTCADQLLWIPRKLEQEALIIVDDKLYQINVINSHRMKDTPIWSGSDEEEEKDKPTI